MRELKFRAWDKKEKCFIIFEPLRVNSWIDKSRNQLKVSILEYNRKQPAKSTNRGAVVMQFTGLKDKNGKEIYEGDIISCRDGIFIIEYEDRFAKFIMTNKDLVRTPEQLGKQDADTCMRSIEVIGNKFENPELLNGN